MRIKNVVPIIIFLFIVQILFGQDVKVPDTFEEAMGILNLDCPDSLQKVISRTPNDSLIELCYPWGGDYKTISSWTSKHPSRSGIKTYLIEQGVTKQKNQEIIILIAFKNSLNDLTISVSEIIKPFKLIEENLSAEDNMRYSTDTLRGVYIPKDLEDCFLQINSFWDDSTKALVRNWNENEFLGNTHLGFGMWIRNNWQLWGGSRLSKYFKDMGVNHPDDMSGIILTSYHRYLNKHDIQLSEQIIYYQSYWEDLKAVEIARKQQDFSHYNLNDTLLYGYPYGYISVEQQNKYYNASCTAKGILIEKNDDNFLIKVRVIETCDANGIISYDNDGNIVWVSETKEWTDPPDRIIEKLKINEEQWFEYEEWELSEY